MGDATATGGSPLVLGVDLLLRHLLLAVHRVFVVHLIDGLHGLHELLPSPAALCPLPHPIRILNGAMGVAVKAGPDQSLYVPTRRPKKVNAAMRLGESFLGF